MPERVDAGAWQLRAGIAVRAIAAIGGGYTLGALGSTALALWLPVPRAEAVTWGLLASFALWAGTVMAVFAARSAARACLGLALAAVLLTVPLVLDRGSFWP